MDNGRTGVILLNCYLPSGPAVKDRREELLSSIFELASTLDSTPVLLTGDFQTDPAASPVLSRVERTGEWTDYYAEFRAASSLREGGMPFLLIPMKPICWKQGKVKAG